MGRRPRSIFCYLCPRNAALAARVCAAIALALRNQCPRAAATRARAPGRNREGTIAYGYARSREPSVGRSCFLFFSRTA